MSENATPLPSPGSITYELIEEAGDLARACERWRREERIALDTEFVRERTFYPALGLLQIAAGGRVTLVDPLAASDLEPFAALLADGNVLKVLHSCSEDLEVFDVHLGVLPQPLFDTQVAATLTAPGHPPGYARLVQELFDIELPKGETRSKWLRRPLRPAQLDYAALDVAHLLPAASRLEERLEELGRRSWLDEEMERLIAGYRETVPDDELYLAVGRAQNLDRRRLAVLRDLFAWRQRTARERDLPRAFVVKDAALVDLAVRRPRRYEQLSEIAALDRRSIERHGRALLRIIRKAAELPAEELPESVPRPVDLSGHKDRVKELRNAVKARAAELGVAPEVLANRRTVEELVRRWIRDADPILPNALRGWREEVIGRDLTLALGLSA